MQKLRLAWRGWQRRREESQQEFVARNAGWSAATPAPATVSKTVVASTTTIDREGLQCAYLDESGQIAYYLDVESGEVVDVRDGAALAAPRYLRVPTRTTTTEDADRRAFVEQLDAGDRQEELARRVDAPEAFRRVLSQDRALEKSWYNFKNDRASAAIDEWLQKQKRRAR
ncbi:MAG: hypothetical protein QOI24_47 [Acidobacteriota bacterium]|jgi:hypothetical protein|nr:hypothetical protein [Acidobacteriota bacterium]